MQNVEDKRPYNPALFLWTLVIAVFLGQLMRPLSFPLPVALLSAWHLDFIVSDGWGRWLPTAFGAIAGLAIGCLGWAYLHWRSMQRQAQALADFDEQAKGYWYASVGDFISREADNELRGVVMAVCEEISKWQDDLRKLYPELPGEIGVEAHPDNGWEMEPAYPWGPLSYYDSYPDGTALSYELARVQSMARDRMLALHGKWRLLDTGNGVGREESLRIFETGMREEVSEAVVEALRPIEELDGVLDAHEELLELLQSGAMPPRVPGKQQADAYLVLPDTSSRVAQEAAYKGVTVLPGADPDHGTLMYLQYGAFSRMKDAAPPPDAES